MGCTFGAKGYDPTIGIVFEAILKLINTINLNLNHGLGYFFFLRLAFFLLVVGLLTSFVIFFFIVVSFNSFASTTAAEVDVFDNH